MTYKLNPVTTPLPGDPAELDHQKDVLQTLLSRIVDAKAGFDTMADKAEPSFRPMVERFRELHDAHASGVSALIVARDGNPDADPGAMGAVNKGVVSIRALFDKIDADVAENIDNGERHVLSAFGDALAALSPSPDRDAVERMRTELEMLLDDLREQKQ